MLIRNITQKEIETIHEKTLYILEHIGVKFEQPELLEFFKKKGIRMEGNRVYIDKATVEQALSTAPASFTIKTPYEELKIGEGGRAISTASGARNILRPDGTLVAPTLEDYKAIRKLDATSPIVNLSSSPLTVVEGIPQDKVDLVKTAYTLEYSKHPVIASCAHKEDAEETIELVRRFYGYGEKDAGYFVIGVGNVISPLRYDRHGIEALLSYTTRNLPVVVACCSTPGMTSPITVGGSIVQNNAEVLAGVVMTQLVNPGCPVVYGNVTFGSNLRVATPTSWGPEVAIFTQYAAAMAKYYKVPYRVGGNLSVAKTVDWQDGAQSALSMMTTLDCGCDFIFHACGELDCLNIFSMEKYVLDEDIIRQRLEMEKRDFITDEAVDMDSIEDVATTPGGNFLAEDDTVELYQTEYYLADLFSCESYDKWQSQGAPSVLERAQKRVEKRLAEFVAPEYTPEQMAILEEAKKF